MESNFFRWIPSGWGGGGGVAENACNLLAAARVCPGHAGETLGSNGGGSGIRVYAASSLRGTCQTLGFRVRAHHLRREGFEPLWASRS